jgi:hypothetical protein
MELPENVTEKRKIKDLKRSEIMSDIEMSQINYFISLLNENRSSMNDNYTRWEIEEQYYANDLAELIKRPNSRANIVNSNIEGLVTQIVNPNLTLICKGVSPEDADFASWGNISLDWAFKENKMHKKCSLHETRRNKFGAAWIKLCWDADFAGQGLPKIMLPGLNKIFVDQKIKDYLRLQEADYIAETINLSKSYAIERYGEEKAEIIDYGYSQYIDNGVFVEEQSSIDENGFTLIQWWSKDHGCLRLREFTGCGVLLFDSFKSESPINQTATSFISPKSFYMYTNNYPYFLTIKYFWEGRLFGFGDAKLLIPMQRLLNEIYDKIRIQMRPNLNLVDVSTNIDLDEFDDQDSFNPIPFDGKAVRTQPVWSIPWGSIGNDFWRLIDQIHAEAQRITRFSDIMTGQGQSTQTATEAAIQQSQGNTHSEHEKMYLEDTLSDVAKYMLALMMEFFKGGKAFRISGEQSQYEWVDFKKLTTIPVLRPASKSYKDKFRRFNPNIPTPEWEHVTDEGGEVMTRSVELDIEISVGSGLPKNKAFLWQMINELSQRMAVDMSSGQPVQRPLLEYKDIKNFIVKYLGIPLSSESEEGLKEFLSNYQNNQPPEETPVPTDINIPVNNSFNPELAQPGATAPMVMPSPQESTEGMSQLGPGQEMNNGIKAGV